MEDGYNEYIISLLESRIRALRLKLDRSKFPVYDYEKLTTSEAVSIEAEIKHYKLKLKLMKINYDF